MSTHRGTNVISRLLLHVLRAETAPLVEAGRKVNRRGWLQITGGGTCFYKASVMTHRGTNFISRLLLHVLRVETAPLVEPGRKVNRRFRLQITGVGTCFYKASMSTHRGTNVFSRLLLHVLRVETAPLVEAGRKVNRRCWLQITGGGTCFYKASMMTHRGTNLISRLLLHVFRVETAPLVEAGRKVNRRCWLQITGGGTCFYKASMSTHRGTNVFSRLLLLILRVESAPLVEAGRKVNRRCWLQITGGGTCFYKASMSTHRGTNVISRLLLHVLRVETAPLVKPGRKVNRRFRLQITGGGTCFYKASMSTHRGTNAFSRLLLLVLRVETAPLVEAGRKVNRRCWLQITGGGTCFYKASVMTHRGTNLISRLLLHVLRVETAPLVEPGRKVNRRFRLQITGGGTCFYKASMSTHRGTNVFSRLLLHVLRVETAPLVEAGRKVNRRCWLQITGGETCFYKASMSTHRGTNVFSRLLLLVLRVETAPLVEAGRKVNRRCWLQITGSRRNMFLQG